MLERIGCFIKRNMALFLCGAVFVAIPLITQECQMIWYQSEEPEEIEKFLK